MYNYALAKDKIPLKTANKMQSTLKYSQKINEVGTVNDQNKNIDVEMSLNNLESVMANLSRKFKPGEAKIWNTEESK